MDEEVSRWTRRRRAIAELNHNADMVQGQGLSSSSRVSEDGSTIEEEEHVDEIPSNSELDDDVTYDGGVSCNDAVDDESNRNDSIANASGMSDSESEIGTEQSCPSPADSILDLDNNNGLDDFMFHGDYDLGYLDDDERDYSSCDEDEGFYSAPDLRESLGDWAKYFLISHSAIGALLRILRVQNPELPKDPRTLLSTPSSIVVHDITGGQYHHIGIEAGVVAKLSKYRREIEHLGDIQLQINIDGLPIFKSSPGQLWPILGMIENLSKKIPLSLDYIMGFQSHLMSSSTCHSLLRN
jgi:hypothetical protein